MKHWREYSKLSIIPKLHGIEAHLLRQMLFVDGGIARLIEHWVKQYHQVGRCYDLSYCRAGSLEKQAEVRSKLERGGSVILHGIEAHVMRQLLKIKGGITRMIEH